MTEWTKYTGQQTQLDEMLSSETGFIVDSEFSVFKDRAVLKYPLTDDNRNWLANHLVSANVDRYMICNPHPNRDIAKRQLDTGQPVYIDYETVPGTYRIPYDYEFIPKLEGIVYRTTKPDWNIPGAKYSLTPFE